MKQVFRGVRGPQSSGTQPSDNAVDHLPVLDPRVPARLVWQQRGDVRLFLVRQFVAVHHIGHLGVTLARVLPVRATLSKQ